MQIKPGQPDGKKFYQLLTGSIAPRPIAFASTMDKAGNVNLSPFSFFNGMGSNPATLIFSPMRRVRNNTTKHTLENIYETMEVVINTVSYDMVQQMSLSSCEFPKGVNEFIKSGLTPVPSELVKPYRVKESPVSFECKVKQVMEMGYEGGAGNLIICEAILIHVKEEVMDDNGYINPRKIDLVGRMGLNYYCRASGNAIFEVPKPNTALGIGFDSLPESVRKSKILSGNDLGQLANVTEMPAIDPAFDDEQLKNIIQYYSTNPDEMETELHHYAKKLLEQNKVKDAWQVLLAGT